MDTEMLDKIIRLVAEHGDRFVVADKASDRAVVVMDLEMYEALLEGKDDGVPAPAPTPAAAAPEAPAPQQKNSPHAAEKNQRNGATLAPLAGLTQSELLDKINRDIGEWKAAQETRRIGELQSAAGKTGRRAPSAPAPAGAEPDAAAGDDEERFFLEPIE